VQVRVTFPANSGSLSATEASIFGGVLKQIAQRVAKGETVSFRPTGNSMVPLIHSRDEVVVSPVDPARVEIGDIVLTKVAGNTYVHLVKAIDPTKRRVQIGKQSRRHQWMDRIRPGVRNRRLGGWNRAAGSEGKGRRAGRVGPDSPALSRQLGHPRPHAACTRRERRLYL
jgi:hypothetical protein